MREFISFQIYDVALFKKQLLKWCAHFPKYCVLDSNLWSGSDNELMAAAGSVNEITPENNSFEELKKFHAAKKDWLFGYLSYDLKNETENLSSGNFDGIGFPQMHFFQPEYIFILRGDKLEIQYLSELSSEKEVENIFNEIDRIQNTAYRSPHRSSVKSSLSKMEYLHAVNKIKHHIRLGDVYEMNYCMEFFAEEAVIDPAQVFLKLSEASQSPFSAFYRSDDKYLMCASPERFLKKEGNKIISQPIKGTAKRGRTDSEDNEIKSLLGQNEKEKSENVMIVDLVRNDLSKSCNNVTVDELFGVYTFKQWHQMISTVSGTLREGVDFTEVIKNSFPMGSMTGAPKVRAMELIEQYEKTKRGLYAGSVGYLSPPHPQPLSKGEESENSQVNFDFNVVIRSILYNQSTKYLSFQAGSAITANSVPEQEYEECLLKAKGMFEALSISAKPLSVNSYSSIETTP
ncbi:MAG: anthranilate synthase component I family protein [Bacteroidetes bacterium]|nr:MAG: anthranilate synthase component I family protein [Bacteroidota bacterium]